MRPFPISLITSFALLGCASQSEATYLTCKASVSENGRVAKYEPSYELVQADKSVRVWNSKDGAFQDFCKGTTKCEVSFEEDAVSARATREGTETVRNHWVTFERTAGNYLEQMWDVDPKEFEAEGVCEKRETPPAVGRKF